MNIILTINDNEHDNNNNNNNKYDGDNLYIIPQTFYYS